MGKLFVGFLLLVSIFSVYDSKSAIADFGVHTFLSSKAQAAEMPAPPEVIGYHDDSSCEVAARGWVKDKNSAEPLQVVFYDRPRESILSRELGSVIANRFRKDLSGVGLGDYAFEWVLPREFESQFLKVHAYAVDAFGAYHLLNRSGQTLFCGEMKVAPVDTYLQIVQSGLKVYARPGYDYRVVPIPFNLRKGVILRTNKELQYDEYGNLWYGVTADIWNRYGSGNWYVPADPLYVQPIVERDEITVFPDTTEKWIEISLSKQTLRAFERNASGEDRLAFESLISTGARGWATPKGTFRLWHFRTHSYMRGVDYNLPGVPFDMYFNGAAAIHGAYWHNNFGRVQSHGCVNLPLDEAEWLWYWVNYQHLRVVVSA